MDGVGVRGCIRWELVRPDGSQVYGTVPNVVTDAGAAFYAARMVGGSAVVTGMKLGTSTTAPAKTGAGAVLGAYLSGSNRALDAIPTVSGATITFKATFPAGVATGTITESVLVTDAITTNATSAAANTVARVLINPSVVKAAADTLTVTWQHTLAG